MKKLVTFIVVRSLSLRSEQPPNFCRRHFFIFITSTLAVFLQQNVWDSVYGELMNGEIYM